MAHRSQYFIFLINRFNLNLKAAFVNRFANMTSAQPRHFSKRRTVLFENVFYTNQNMRYVLIKYYF